jgi:hypothetical protein
MLSYYLLSVFWADMGVPGAFWVNHNHWTIAALIKAACFIDANLPFEALGYNFLTQGRANFFSTIFRTDFARRADKYVLFKDFHRSVLPVASLIGLNLIEMNILD